MNKNWDKIKDFVFEMYLQDKTMYEDIITIKDENFRFKIIMEREE
jgi:hypothetical protein